MTPDEFVATLSDPTPPTGAGAVLAALWHDARGEWAAAHALAQAGEGTPACDRLHAYLHRKEGDGFNAGYWYRRAGTPAFEGPLQAEWAELVKLQLT